MKTRRSFVLEHHLSGEFINIIKDRDLHYKKFVIDEFTYVAVVCTHNQLASIVNDWDAIKRMLEVQNDKLENYLISNA